MEETIILIEKEDKENIIYEPFIEQLKPTTQEKTITPSQSSQIVEPDNGVFALSKVMVEPIPSEYVKPEGTLDIVSNGKYDVKSYEMANVSVPTGTDNYFKTNINENLSGGATIFSRFIKELPDINFEIADLYRAFRYLYNCTKIGKISATNPVTNMTGTWEYCQALEIIDISGVDTSQVAYYNNTFQACSKLKKIIGVLDVQSASGLPNTFNNDFYLEEVYIKNLHFNPYLSNTAFNNLKAECIDYLLYNVQDVTASPQTLTLGTINLAKASEDAIAHATSLGWTIN